MGWPSRSFERTASGAQLYQIIHVAHDSLQFEARVANGELYDAFTLKKRDGQPNQLIEQKPNIVESRKPLVVNVTTDEAK